MNIWRKNISPISLSIVTPNGSLSWPLVKFFLSKILQENDCQSQSPICKVAPYPLFLQSSICKNEACTITDAMAAIQSLANASAAKTFGELCGTFSTYVTSHVSDKCTRVDVVSDRYLPNSIKGGNEA